MKKLITISSIFFLFLCCSGTEELGILSKSRNKSVLGQDGASAIPVSANIYMWTFGDTLLGSRKNGAEAGAGMEESAEISAMISNSLAFTEAPDPENINDLDFVFVRENGSVCQFIKNKKDENPANVRLWAADGIRVDDRVYVYYYIISNDIKGVPFYLKAVGIAGWDIPLNWKIGDEVRFARLKDLFGRDYPAFGAAVMEKDGYIYTAGHFNSADKKSPVKIARVKPRSVENGSLYEFLGEGGHWIKNIDDAASFLGDVMGECSLSYNEYLGRYVIIYCQSWTGKIIIIKFNDFKDLAKAEKTVVYEPPALDLKKLKSPRFYYSGKEIFSSGSSIFMIYINPVEYQPYLLKINLGFNFPGQ